VRPTQAAPGALHGIILGNKNEPAAFGAQLVALDPQTGSSTQTRDFVGGGSDSSAQLTFDDGCGSAGVSEPHLSLACFVL